MAKATYSLPLLQSCANLANHPLTEQSIAEAVRRCLNMMSRDVVADDKCSRLYDYLRGFGELDRKTITRELEALLLIPTCGQDQPVKEEATA